MYAQYATLVADEVAAAWSGDPERAGSVSELAQERAELAERYEALRVGPTGGDGFETVLAEAVTELDHQAAVERSLRDRLEGLHHGELLLGAGAVAEAGPEAAVETIEDVDEGGRGELPPEIGGALVAARSRGVGGVLGGQYPGVVAGAGALFGGPLGDVVGGAEGAVGGAPSGGPQTQVDLTF